MLKVRTAIMNATFERDHISGRTLGQPSLPPRSRDHPQVRDGLISRVGSWFRSIAQHVVDQP